MQKTRFFTKIIFCSITFLSQSAWLFNYAVCKIGLRIKNCFNEIYFVDQKKEMAIAGIVLSDQSEKKQKQLCFDLILFYLFTGSIL
jgi:hypothetical protein